MKFEEAIQKLIEGNKRFINLKLIHPNQNSSRCAEVLQGQKPFAVIVGCSDSRIPPEIIFDQGIGDLFIIRTAGNIVDDIAIGSIEYAVDHLGVQLVVVMGHGKCGAVTATVQGGEARGCISCILNNITPAVEKAKKQSGDLINNAIRNNIDIVVKKLASSKPILSESIDKGKLKIIGAYYNIESRAVEIV